MAVADPIVGVGKILIVEDDRHELRALSEFLERKGIRSLKRRTGGKRWTISATVLPFLSSCSTSRCR
jgi:hypothetical protein